jgi:hypothetical protein
MDVVVWLRSLAAVPWKRPSIGSRVNREVHARIWERPGVRFLRATRPKTGMPEPMIFVCLSL